MSSIKFHVVRFRTQTSIFTRLRSQYGSNISSQLCDVHCVGDSSVQDGERNRIRLGSYSSGRYAALLGTWKPARYLRSRRKLSRSQM